jgi:Flp pilus assembly protein protease CpaA
MDEMFALLLELTRFLPLSLVMLYAAFHDYRTGLVPNKIWLYAIVGGALTIIETALFYSVGLLVLSLVSIVASVAVGFLTFGLGGGGADAKALMTLGVSVPVFPLWSFLWPMPLPLAALLVASVVTLVYAVVKPKRDVPFVKRKIRFLPFLFIGLMVCVFL